MILLKALNSILLWLMDIPNLNIVIGYILRPIKRHKRVIVNTLKNISYSNILDYGCGEGLFTDCFNELKYVGYDPAVKKIIYAKKKFVKSKFLTEIPDFRMFDFFFLNNVLHHMNPSQIRILINNISRYAKINVQIMIIELRPMCQQKNFILKLILYLESRIHYSDPRVSNFYEQEMQNQGFTLTDKKDLGAYYLLLYKK